jgi:hypothetical protein
MEFDMTDGSHVYYKADWDFGRDYPEDLPADQVFVHCGMFLGWLIDNRLCSEQFENDLGEDIAAFRRREISGAKVLEANDGMLIDHMLTGEGNEFASDYFEHLSESYSHDYDRLLTTNLPSVHHVPDTWENYQLMRRRINERYAEWKAGRNHS